VDAERQVAIAQFNAEAGVAGSGNGGGTLVDVLLANVIRDERNQRLVGGGQG
jgi:hypothetical protein